jgi:hypothetical protein
VRFDNWKVVFCEQRAQGTLRIWAEPYTILRVPKVRGLRRGCHPRRRRGRRGWFAAPAPPAAAAGARGV